MRRTATALAIVAALATATPSLAQEGPSFGALVGNLVGGAIDAASVGRKPRGGDFVSGGKGRSGEGAGHAGGHSASPQSGIGGQHRQAQAAGGGERKGPQAGGGGQVHRKQGK